MDSNKLLESKIDWKSSSNMGYFYAYFENKLIYLRLNNFPEEPLYTLINGLDIIDLEERPTKWDFEG